MSKAYFNCGKCGDAVTVTGQNSKLASSKAEWKESQGFVCTSCWKAEKAEKHAQENRLSGLPELTGSPKQVAWAETIRKKKLDEVDRWLNGDSSEVYQGRERTLFVDDTKTPAAIEVLKAQTAAAWWIDWRDAKGHALLTRIAEKTS